MKEQLEKILKKHNMIHVCERKNEPFIQDLLHWKYPRYWCEHFYPSYSNWDKKNVYIYTVTDKEGFNERANLYAKWNFCPICGAKRPDK